MNLCRINNSFPQYQMNYWHEIDVADGEIKIGQGEYIVFPSAIVTRKKYDFIYQIFNNFACTAMVHRGEECSSRFELIRDKVKEIDSGLDIAFVPRTLYELILLRCFIQEELGPQKSLYPILKRFSEIFWTGERVQTPQDNNYCDIQALAFCVNQIVVNTLFPTPKGFSCREFVEFAEREITFLKEHCRTFQAERFKKLLFSSLIKQGPTHDFGSVYAPTSMGIRGDADAQIIRNAIAMECSLGQDSFLLYRGAEFQNDAPFTWFDENIPFSLSYGTSLFAGTFNDPLATAFLYMRNCPNAFLIRVPFVLSNHSPFYIPPSNTVAQLMGRGEVFHARLKKWDGGEEVEGVYIRSMYDLSFLESKLSQTEFKEQFWKYMFTAIQLKPENQVVPIRSYRAGFPFTDLRDMVYYYLNPFGGLSYRLTYEQLYFLGTYSMFLKEKESQLSFYSKTKGVVIKDIAKDLKEIRKILFQVQKGDEISQHRLYEIKSGLDQIDSKITAITISKLSLFASIRSLLRRYFRIPRGFL